MRHLITILLIFIITGCSYFGDEKEDETKGWDADHFYAEANAALESGEYEQAVELYQKLETRYPFGVHAQQALLDLSYAYYKNDEPEASISACNRFIKLYPQNRHVDYAYYLKGLANFNKGKGFTQRYLPTDESQRDPGAALNAFESFSELVKRYPDSVYVQDAEQRMRYLRNILAKNEVHVANYYMRRGAFVAAVNRARFVVENYPRTPSVPDALVVLAKAYRVLEMNDLSDDALRVLELNYPNHPGAYDAKNVKVK
ncbi:MAG: outer membrane protein assembly factor BamD [Proteobacteria bacterium]|nr:outer membrane protein assembly factor BamD [Pseudomonadota bacterium]NOG60113.1 outer membrane protein assembly factor BamD [Pseudomonadota bacterium]